MKKITNKYRMFLIIPSPIIIIFPISVLFAKFNKKAKNGFRTTNKISRPEPTKILSLEGISESITLSELNKILNPGGFKATAHPDHVGNKNYRIEYKAPFGGIECEKKFVFTNTFRIKLCNYGLYNFDDISEPQGIYEEICNSNGVPDTIYFDKEIFLLQCTWYGKNGTIVYNHFNRGFITVVFKLYV